MVTYYAIKSGSTTLDITSYMGEPDISGLEVEFSKFSSPLGIYSTLSKTGISNLQFRFNVWYDTLTGSDTFLKTINSLTEDATFYFGSADWFYHIKYISVRPVISDHKVARYVNEVTLELEDPYIYANTATTLSNSSASCPYTPANTFLNNGTVNTPFYSIGITGTYSTYHMVSPTFYIMDNAIVCSSLLVSNRLMSNEVATIDQYGVLTSVYTEDYASSTRFGQDKYASANAAVANSALEIAAQGYATYKFYGPHPLKENIKLTMNASVTGNAIVYVSDDNTSWNTAIRTVDLTANSGLSTDHYLSYSEKLADIYVKFNCPAGATMNIADANFVMTRDTSYYTLPTIAVDATRTIKVDDAAANSSHSCGVVLNFRPRKWPS